MLTSHLTVKSTKNWGGGGFSPPIAYTHAKSFSDAASRVTLAFSDTTHSRTTADLGLITTTYLMAYLFMMPSFGTSRFVYKDYN